jgi:peptidoglycan lytic transglycosylase G
LRVSPLGSMKKNLFWAAIALSVTFFSYVAVEMFLPVRMDTALTEFEARNGATFRQIVDSLAEKGILRDRSVFYLLGRLGGIERKVKAGYYPLRGMMSPWEIFKALREGAIIEYVVTVVPGDSLFEVGMKFMGLGMTDMSGFLKLCADRDFLDDMDVDSPSVEGYLYPDTYRFPKGSSIKEVLTMMVERMREKYDEAMLAQTCSLELKEREVLTIASIIEKEAATDEERPIIAAVYFNRLKRGMPLQADPTVIYGVKHRGEKINKDDIARNTPYNTYTIRGLPPGPIASPGLKSIMAALNPSAVPYLYFVSNNDGTHTFSVTLGQHAKAVKSYREKKRATAVNRTS